MPSWRGPKTWGPSSLPMSSGSAPHPSQRPLTNLLLGSKTPVVVGGGPQPTSTHPPPYIEGLFILPTFEIPRPLVVSELSKCNVMSSSPPPPNPTTHHPHPTQAKVFPHEKPPSRNAEICPTPQIVINTDGIRSLADKNILATVAEDQRSPTGGGAADGHGGGPRGAAGGAGGQPQVRRCPARAAGGPPKQADAQRWGQRGHPHPRGGPFQQASLCRASMGGDLFISVAGDLFMRGGFGSLPSLSWQDSQRRLYLHKHRH